jgi:hypothetical protein
MKMFTLLFAVVSIFNLSAKVKDLASAPPPFKISKTEQAVFIDIEEAKYSISYDLKKQVAKTYSVLVFKVEEEGYPLFDLKEIINSVKLDDEVVTTSSIMLEGSTMLMVKKFLKVGKYELKVESTLKKNLSINFLRTEVRSAFWMSDLDDRSFLEQYLPTNLEFDHYPSKLEVEILGTATDHQIYSNGEVISIDKNKFNISFPAHFTCSSLYFHLAPKFSFAENRFTYQTKNSRSIPVTVYSQHASDTKIEAQVRTILNELENDYGPWPHQNLIIYISGNGGMEYAGATITSNWALSHELFHSYFARGVMPGIGNSGWIDEALARWRDYKYVKKEESDLQKSKLAAHSVYRRHTDREAYEKGSTFMGYLHQLLSPQKDFREFLGQFYRDNLFKTITTEQFQNSLESHYSLDLDHLFGTYIYGRDGSGSRNEKENPYHKKLTEKQLLEIL